jgi:vitamin B12 transporter
LIRRPHHQAAFQLQAPLGPRGTGSIALRYTGSRDDLDFSTFPATRVTLRQAAVVDVAGEYELPLGTLPALLLSLRVENVCDDDARDIANFPARGRVIMIGGGFRLGP